ncbi:AEC family transporter [Imbroritus primus]|uniref:AEC family transporter n=1 Tax=Imbroritus primus TaxID=3058603 RepID=A0ACD3SM88_9BURK|nr:AEC family transporter [Burkholderiaceae bacterium PBA]
MNSPALAALLPVILLIALGWTVARVNWVSKASLKDFTNLLFLVLLPALLFRTMARVKLAELDFAPIGIYFLSVGIVFGVTMLRFGFNTLSAARGLAHIFSNTVLIGVPLIGLAFGEQGLVALFTLVSVHSLVILTTVTLIFELAIAREQRAAGIGAHHSLLRTVLVAVRKSILHPVPLPILIGLLYGQLGLPLPEVVDISLKMLGAAMGPLALLLVGATLAYPPMGSMWKPALRIALCKVVVHPLVFLACAWALGQRSPAINIMQLLAALPVGANVFLFTQRYKVAEDEVSTSIAISTAMALVTVPVVLALLARFG